MSPKLYESYQNFNYTFISLFSIVNPIGMAPIFLSMTQDHRPEQRRKMAWQIAFYTALLLVCVFFLGTQILNFFGVSLASLQIAGGFLIFATAWGMLNAPTKPVEHDGIREDSLMRSDITFFPLTMPLTAGGGTIAVTVALAAKFDEDVPSNYVINHLSPVLAIFAVCIVIGICYSFADRIFSRLGTAGTNVLTRLTAFILLAIGVNIIWRGVMAFLLMLNNGSPFLG